MLIIDEEFNYHKHIYPELDMLKEQHPKHASQWTYYPNDVQTRLVRLIEPIYDRDYSIVIAKIYPQTGRDKSYGGSVGLRFSSVDDYEPCVSSGLFAQWTEAVAKKQDMVDLLDFILIRQPVIDAMATAIAIAGATKCEAHNQ